MPKTINKRAVFKQAVFNGLKSLPKREAFVVLSNIPQRSDFILNIKNKTRVLTILYFAPNLFLNTISEMSFRGLASGSSSG